MEMLKTTLKGLGAVLIFVLDAFATGLSAGFDGEADHEVYEEKKPYYINDPNHPDYHHYHGG